jgi:hypothetical protein
MPSAQSTTTRRSAEGVRAVRTPLRDFTAPPREEMRMILDLIDSELTDGGAVYLHCYGGIGRTGTVVGCWLVRHGTPPEDAIEAIGRAARGGRVRRLAVARERGAVRARRVVVRLRRKRSGGRREEVIALYEQCLATRRHQTQPGRGGLNRRAARPRSGRRYVGSAAAGRGDRALRSRRGAVIASD